MKNKDNIMVMKKFLVVALLLLSISSVSAFCKSQGYLLDEDKDFLNVSKVNVICKRSAGDLISEVKGEIGYGFPFGDWYDDCTYCDLGIKVIAFEDEKNLYGEYFNETCNSENIETCHTNIYLRQISEDLSSKDYYSSGPNVGTGSPVPRPMPKSNVTPNETVKGIKEDFAPVDYPRIYLSIFIFILIIFIIILIQKYGK